MRCERQDREFGQPPPDRVALSPAEFDGRANEIGAVVRIDSETVNATAGKNRRRKSS